jgi:small subunit ribosomal protein S9
MKVVHCSGKRKTAIARATLKPGKGKIRINKIPLEIFEPCMSRLKIQEPLRIAGDSVKKFDIDVNVSGGGQTSQADAARLAVARVIIENDKSKVDDFLEYDRHLLVADVRRKETHKPNCHGKARSKRQKSYR